MARRRTRSASRKNGAAGEEQLPGSRPQRQGTSRRKRRFAFALLLGGLLIYFLPVIVAKTPLGQAAVNSALARLRGKVTIDSMSLGWFSPVRFTGVHMTDVEGQSMLVAPDVTTSRTLLGLINAENLGTITLERPVITVQVREGGTNIEDAIAALIEPSDPGAVTPRMEIVVHEGQLEMLDTVSGQTTSLNELSAVVRIPGDDAPLSATFEALDGTRGTGGRLNATLTIDKGNDDLTFANGEVRVVGKSMPLDVASPVLTRFVEPIQLGGLLDGEALFGWSNWGERVAADFRPVTVTSMRLRAPRRIGTDEIRVEDAWLQGRAGFSGDAIEAADFICRTELVSLKADGTLTWEQLTAVASGQIPASEFHAEGSLNVAPLVRMLPETLPLQQGVEIESGTVQFNADSRAEGADRRVTLNISSAGISAIRAGTRIQWDQPVQLAAVVRQGSNSTILESLDCKAGFFTINGNATAERGDFAIAADLRAALTQFSQFFDPRGVQLGGKIDGDLAWQFDGDPRNSLSVRPMRVGGRFRIEQPLVNLPGIANWSEDEINLAVQAAGQLQPGPDGTNSFRLDSGNVELTNPLQSLRATLVEPLVSPIVSSPVKLDCRVTGDAAAWLARLQTWVPIEFKASGQLDAGAVVSLANEQIQIDEGKFQVDEFRFEGYGLDVSEPQFQGNAVVRITPGNGRIEIADASVTSTTLAARGRNVVMEPQTSAFPRSGNVAFRADVQRTLRWLGPSQPDAVQWFGLAQGAVDLTPNAEFLAGTVNLQINDLVAARQAQPTAVQPVRNASAGEAGWTRLLEERQVTITSSAQIDPTFDRIVFRDLDVASSALKMRASGSVSDLGGSVNADVSGNWTPDWSRLEPLFQSYAGGLVTLNQVRGGEFAVRGPVFISPTRDGANQPWLNPQLQAAAAAGFDSGTLLGMPIGGSTADIRLAGGVAEIKTVPIQFAGGTISLQPAIDMRGASPVLAIPAGPIADNVELTPEICRGWLRYVAPVVADATAANGKFSLSTDGARIPLDNTALADVSGKIVVHGANVGPGPLGQQLMTIARQVKGIADGSLLSLQAVAPAASQNVTWMSLPQQQVPFAIRNGRVAHEGLQFQIDDVAVRTSGSVGLDQSLQMTAEIPIVDKWVEGNRLASGLRGQKLQLPVTGTVTRPQIDNSALAGLSQNLLRGAATNVIQQEAQGLLESGSRRLEDELFKGFGRLLDSGKEAPKK